MLCERTESRSEPANNKGLAYINWYINGYGRSRTSLDMIPEMRHDPGQPAGSCGVLPATKINGQQPLPSAAKYPRGGDGRKGAFGVACDGARRHPCPRHHDEHSGQEEGTGQK